MERIPYFSMMESQGKSDAANRYLRVQLKLFTHGTDPLSFDKKQPHRQFVETKEEKS